MKTKFELKIVNDGVDFEPLTWELEGKISKEDWEAFRTILPMFLEQSTKKDVVESAMMADVKVLRADEELAA